MRQLFIAAELVAGSTAEVAGEDYVHLTRSLRAKVGEAVRMVDLNFQAFQGMVVAIDRRSATLRADLKLPALPEAASLTLGLCAPAHDAFDATLDAAVQLGVTDLVPLHSVRSRVVDAAKMSRWERIARESCCQSLRIRPPRLHAPRELDTFLKSTGGGKNFLAWQQGGDFDQNISSTDALRLVVGPEGGFEDEELATARAEGWHFVKLGPHVLRVPVAAAAGLGVLLKLRGMG